MSDHPAPPVSSDWFAALDAALGESAWTLGVTGHLLLTHEEESRLADRLHGPLFDELRPRSSARDWVILTGLAPGADLLLTRTLLARAKALNLPCRVIGLLPAPLEILLADWEANARAAGFAVSREQRARHEREMRSVMAHCSARIAMSSAGDSAQLSEPQFRRRQYRRLAACLAQQSDLLLAALRPDHAGGPGGTAEVVLWRRNPRLIPEELRLGGDAQTARSALVLIDPAGEEQAATPLTEARYDPASYWLRRATEALDAGNPLLCYDLVSEALRDGASSPRLRYLAVLALANSGSTRAALERYSEWAPAPQETNEDWLALKGRLHKNLALEGGPSAAIQFAYAAECYRAAHQYTSGEFSGVNAATMSLLAGQREEARKLASEILQHLRSAKPESEAAHYYRHASEAEAYLILGDSPRARLALASADRHLPGKVSTRARTRAQLALICTELQLDPGLLEQLSLPPVVVLDGRQEPPTAEGAFVYAAIDLPARLTAVETAQARKARVHLVLPQQRSELLQLWGEAHGEAAQARLARCIAQADELSVLHGFLPAESGWRAAYAAQMAQGLARIAARRLGLRSRGAAELAPMPDSGDAARSAVGMLFADFTGFTRLADDELPAFSSVLLGDLAAAIRAEGERVLYVKNWGDAVHAVTADAATSARLACAMLALVEARRSRGGGFAAMGLRVAAHHGPAWRLADPFGGPPTWLGSQLTFTARIEPITPPGIAYVTEAMAARLALEAPEQFHTEYAGELDVAKRYGKFRLFSLRNRGK